MGKEFDPGNLKSNERKYRALFDNAPIGISIVDADRNIIEANRTLEKVAKITKNELNKEAYKQRRYIHPDGTEFSVNELPSTRALKEGTPVLDVEIGIASGSMVIGWTQVSAAPLDIPERCAVVITQDITDHKNLEMQLKASEEKFRSFYENSMDAMLLTTPEGSILSANQAACKMFQRTEEEMCGIGRNGLVDISDPRLPLLLEKREHIGRASGELSMIRKDGTKFPVELTTSVFKNSNGRLSTSMIIRDITDRNYAEEALKKSEARFRSYFELSIAGIAITSPSAGWIEVNDHLCEMLGYSREELLKTTWSDLTHPEDVYLDLDKLNLVMKGEIEGYSIDKRFIRKDGESIWNSLSVRCVRLIDGKVDYFVALLFDITTRKRAEHILRQNEEKYRLLFENMVHGVFYQLADGTLTDINPAGLKMFGLTRDQFEGRTSYHPDWKVIDEKQNVLKPEQHPSMIALKTATEVEMVLGVFNPVQKDYVWLSVCAKPQFLPEEDKPFLVFVTMHDITERKLMEDVLQNMSNELQLIFNNMINAFIVWDSVFDENGNYISFRFGQFNDAYARISKLNYKDVHGKDVFEIWPDNEQSWVNAFGKVALTGNPDTFDMYHGPTKGWYHCNAYRPTDSPDQICVFFEDITERKEAEDLIKESEERFRMVFENVFDGISIYDEDTDPLKRKLIECNAQYAAMAGRTREELLGFGNTQTLQITLDDTANKTRLESLSENVEFRGSFSWIRPDGKENYIEYIGMPIVWRGKSLSIGIDRDVTIQKQAEEQLRSSAEKYHSIFENVQDVYYETSMDGLILEVSPSIEIITNGQYHRDDLIGKTMYDFYPNLEERNTLLSLLKEFGSVRDFEMTLRNKDGSLVPCAVSSKLWYDSQGNLSKIIGSMRDITARKKLEIEQFRLLDIIEKSLNEIYVFDSTTLKFEYLNQGASHNIGYTHDEMKDMTPLDIKPLYSLERFKEMIQPLINREKEKIVFETIHRRKNKTDYNVEVHLQLHSTEDRRLFFAVIIDITERKRIEKEILDLNLALEKRVIERTKELELKNTELARMNRLFVGRELRMAELKQTIKQLETKQGR